MTAITLQIMVNAPTHDLSHDPAKAAQRYRNGDIVATYPTEDSATFIGGKWRWNDVISSPRLSFIHIRDLPVNLEALANQRLTKPISVLADTIRRRQYRFPEGVLPVALQDELDTEREITVTWGIVKAFIRKKIVTVSTDPLQDDESTSIVDSDLL